MTFKNVSASNLQISQFKIIPPNTIFFVDEADENSATIQKYKKLGWVAVINDEKPVKQKPTDNIDNIDNIVLQIPEAKPESGLPPQTEHPDKDKLIAEAEARYRKNNIVEYDGEPDFIVRPSTVNGTEEYGSIEPLGNFDNDTPKVLTEGGGMASVEYIPHHPDEVEELEKRRATNFPEPKPEEKTPKTKAKTTKTKTE